MKVEAKAKEAKDTSPKSERVLTTTVRLPERIFAKVEKLREEMRGEFPGSAPSVSDAIRVAIERGLR